ncbi:S1C family serine protease [Nakamurella lactea]|uniref:S1C family serine protease n=1 Tax=Nakamurella lactea TaxID=459515 RepID=UPI0004192FE6|nr:trypsin-like peptidase domain-containing protein [Nakamurella lactea]
MSSPKPPIDPATAAAFGRPGQVNGSFAPRGQRPPQPISTGAVVPEMLVDAFGRPDPATPGLRRPEPGPVVAEPAEPEDPWRDPQAGVTLGPPALDRPEPEHRERPPVQRFTLRQALFDHRLRPSALVSLAVGALVVGAIGGLIVALLGRAVPISATDPEYTLSQVSPAIAREPGSVAAVAGKVVPAVVSLEVRTGDTGDTGSGVVIDPQGHILTNNHVVSLAATDKDAVLSVVFSDGTRVPGTIVGRDPQSDLAVVQVDKTENMTVAQLGNSDTLAVGDTVIAIGSPLGLQGTVTTGIVSAKNRPVRLSGEGTDTNAVIDALQTDAAVNPGNSGGPLVDAAGAVIGINTAIRTLGDSAASGSIGLGFAIPINDAKATAEQIIRTGKVVHPTIGVNARSATDGTTDGAQVQNVQDGSAAAKAGIVEGDVITKVGDRAVGNADELVVAVQEHQVGESVPVVLKRGGKNLTVTVTLTAG